MRGDDGSRHIAIALDDKVHYRLFEKSCMKKVKDNPSREWLSHI
jgi:hypothetical protein